jgi:hypothetical protein
MTSEPITDLSTARKDLARKARQAATSTHVPEPRQRRTKEEHKTKRQALLEFISSHWYTVTEGGFFYALPLEGLPIAVQLGKGSPFFKTIAERYEAETGEVLSGSDIKDVMQVLEGRARKETHTPTGEPIPVTLHLRRADLEPRAGTPRTLLVDLGTHTGQLVQVTAQGWKLISETSEIFRRSALTGPMPTPVATDGDPATELVTMLARHVNATEEELRLIAAWAITAFMNIERPILWITGRQGSGKSNAARFMVDLLDPSKVSARPMPKDEENWYRMAHQSAVMSFDNLSSLSKQWSDTLCRAVTGDSLVQRQRYADEELSIVVFTSAIIMTSINPQAARGDLVSRLLPIHLEPLTHSVPRSTLDKELKQAKPVLLGHLFSLIGQVFAQLEEEHTTAAHRLGDFATVLQALDQITGWTTLQHFQTLSAQSLAELLEGDLVGAAVVDLVQSSHQGSWTGTVQELLKALETRRPDTARAWPQTPKALGGILEDIAPVLAQHHLQLVRKRTKTGVAVDIFPMPVAFNL